MIFGIALWAEPLNQSMWNLVYASSMLVKPAISPQCITEYLCFSNNYENTKGSQNNVLAATYHLVTNRLAFLFQVETIKPIRAGPAAW